MKTFIDFYSLPCAPCQRLDTILNAQHIPVKRVNAMSDLEAVLKYHISSLPTLIFLDGDKEVDRTTGFSNTVIEKIKAFGQ